MNGDGNWGKERGAEGRVEKPEANAGGAVPIGVCPDRPSRTSSSRNSRRRGQESTICESPCPEEKAQAEGVKLRPGLLRKRHHLLGRPARKRLTYRRFLSSASHFPSRMAAAPSRNNSRTTSSQAHSRRLPQPLPFSTVPSPRRPPTTPCACSPDRPHRIWKTTRGTPRNRRARRRATAGRDRRTLLP